MMQQPSKNRKADQLLKPERKKINKPSKGIRNWVEARLSKSNIDIARLSKEEVRNLVVELTARQLELEEKNGELDKAIQDLNASCKRYEQLYDGGTIAYLRLDEEGVIQQVNLAAAQILACPQEMLVNKKLGDFIHAEDQDVYHAFIKGFATQKTEEVLSVRLSAPKILPANLFCPGFRLTNCSQQSCHQDFGSTYVECRHAVNFQADNDHHICLTINDVSERKLAEASIACLNGKLEERIVKQTQELTESNRELQKKVKELGWAKHQILEREAKLMAIFNAATDGIVTVNSSCAIVSVNSAVETIFGYSQDELIGSDISKLIPYEIKRHGTCQQRTMPKASDRIRCVDGMRKDGSIVPLDVSVAQFSVAGAEYLTSIVRDVSSRKIKEQEDKAHLDELAHVTRLGLMGEMASGIAHEVNQPLSAIAAYTRACLNFLKAENPDLSKLQDILQKTYQQALSAGQIIHRTREFVKFKSNHRSNVKINDLIIGCVSLCSSDLKHNNISQKLKLAENLPLVYADDVQIEQVLLNLVRNSLDALKSRPETAPRRLSIETCLDDRHKLLVRVKDNGPGIEKTDQAKILTPFYSTKQSGMGMGLSISQSIIKAHDGVLSFNSIPGKGATFYFTLPVQKQ